jgi:hypothetical protein
MPIFAINSENIAQCVVPQNNRDELEIQFQDSGKAGRHEDNLVQMTLHFPAVEDGEEESLAEAVQGQIMKLGVLSSLTGDILAEFSKEMGNFVSPRGKYALQVSRLVCT